MITIGTLFLVVGAVERSHVVDWLARKTFGTTGSLLWSKVRMYCTCFSLSIFFNNTPLVAILMPVVKDWGRMRGIGASQLLMPLSYSVLAGSFVTMIGTSTNLTVQGLMQADRGYSFSFFSPAPFGFPLFAILLVYMIFAAHFILPHNKSGLIREARDKANSLIAEIYVTESSPVVGKSVGDMANSLGVAPSSVIKVRRRIGGKKSDEENGGKMRKSASASILDQEYLRKAAQFWRSGANSSTDNLATGTKTSVKSSDGKYEAAQQQEVDIEHQPPEYFDIIAPSYHEIIGAEDVVFISSAQDVVEKMMKSIMGESKGLRILKSDVLALPGFGTEVVECVVSDSNPFLGLKVSEFAQLFNDRYSAAVITVRSKEWVVAEEENEEEKSEGGGSSSVPDSTTKASSNEATGGIPRNESRQSDIGLDLSSAVNTFEVSGNFGVSQQQVDRYHEVELGEVELTNLVNDKKRGSFTQHSQQGASMENSSSDGSQDQSNTRQQHQNKDSDTLLDHHKAKVNISEHPLTYGDIILCVTNEKELKKLTNSRDFYVVSTVGSLPKPLTFYTLVPLLLFIVMLILVAVEYIDICPAALALTALFFIGGWIKPEDIPVMVDVRLLMLLGASLSFATSMTKSGLAETIAKTIGDSNPSPFNALLLVYALTLVITELISNNAAAALMYPIAVKLADELGVSFKPFAMCVLLSSTAGFMSPIGYQTHVMVWGPGGYRFRDFLVFGLVPDIIYWIIGCLLIPAVYPFNA